MTELTVARSDAGERIQRQIERGTALKTVEIRSQDELEANRTAYYTWDDYNVELLKKLFTTPEEAETYSRSAGILVLAETSLGERIAELRDDVSSKIRRLESVVERLELFDEAPTALGAGPDSQELIARRLLETLAAIRDSNFQNRALIQEAKILNARLNPTYMRIYGRIPEITTTYPPLVWWPRAQEYAEQALAMASAPETQPPHAPPPSVRTPSDRVFIVHGRDEGLKEAVARLVDRLGYKPVILHERPDKGQTIIEKFESEAPDAAFALILLTPDDEGRLRTDGSEVQLRPRARQNVVWEFGYFIALVGRDHVVALVAADKELERPTDIDGVLYIPITNIQDQNWRLRLAREMKAAGLEIDMNRVQ